MSNLVLLHDSIPVVSHRTIAENTGNKQVSIRNLINRFKADFEVFGTLHFKNEGVVNNGKGEQPKTYLLNEQQATLLLTYLRNTEVVRAFKVALVKEFYKMREKLYQTNPSPAKIGELEQRIYMLKRENTELKRAINRLTYNQKHSESKRKIFIDDNGNEIDLIKLWNRGVFPYIPEAVKELREKIAKELGSVGHVYQAKLLEIERLFSAKPLRIGNGVIVGSVMFPDALLESRPEKDMPVIGR